MKKRMILYADDGMVLTNGKDYGDYAFLAVGDSGENWREITAQEAEALQAEQTDNEVG